MTQERIRDLLNDVADTVPAPDVAERAWQRSRRVRRRRRVAGTSMLAVGMVVAALAVVGVIDDAQPGARGPDREQVAKPMPVPKAAKPRPADARVEGEPTWIGPRFEQEDRLPQQGSALPESIDLSEAETTDTPGRSLAAFAASDDEPLEEVLLVNSDGEVSRLELDESLYRTENDKGDSFLPLNIESLSPNGRYLALAQQEEVVLYDLVEGGEPQEFDNQYSESWNVGWTKTADEGWQIQLVKDVMDPVDGSIEARDPQDGEPDPKLDSVFPVELPIWPERTDAGREAQVGRPSRDAPRFVQKMANPLFVTVDGSRSALLVLPGYPDDLPPRSRVVDWIGGDTVAFQSQDYGAFHVLGWDTRTGAVRMVSDVELPDDWADGVIASWAKVPR